MNSGSSRTNRMLIFLDSILDTRLSVMASLRKSLPKRVLATGKYIDRETDRFTDILPNFPMDDYTNKWNSRSKDDIREECYPTFLLAFIAKMIEDIEMQSVVVPNQEKPEVTINTAPYQIDDSGKDALVRIVHYHLGVSARVINVPIDYCHPNMLRDNYDDVFIYEFDKWLTIHMDSVKSKHSPSLHIYAPLLTVKKPDRNYDIMKDKSFMETTMAAFMSLHYLSAGTFSMAPIKVTDEK